MKILIVHDRQDVTKQVCRLLVEVGVNEEGIAVTEDCASARAKLSRNQYDLAIIDLTVPAVKGVNEPSYLTVEDLLNELFRTTEFITPGDIIGITRDVSAFEAIKTSIGQHLMALIDENNSGWRNQLADRVRYLLRVREARLNSMANHHNYDVAIMTALDEEMLPYREWFEFNEVVGGAGIREFVFRDSLDMVRRGIAYSVGWAGQAPAAAVAQMIIGRYRPRNFLLSGICGGVRGEVSIGDVIIFETVYDWDSGKWKEPENRKRSGNGPQGGLRILDCFYPRSEPLSIRSDSIMSDIRDIQETGLSDQRGLIKACATMGKEEVSGLVIKRCKCASGSSVIGHPEIMDKIVKHDDRIFAVDMESYGFYYAGKYGYGVPPRILCVKAVSDFCDGLKDDGFHPICSYLSAVVVKELITKKFHYC